MSFLRPAVFLAVALLGACAHSPSRAPAPDSGQAGAHRNPQLIANAVLFRALALVGTPYRYGGNTPESGFDCSGLVGYVFRDAAAISLPRTSAALGALDVTKVDHDELRSGDLVLFGSRGRIGHVGIYVGDGRFVHAPNRGGTVRLDRLDAPGWKETFRYGRRVID